MKTLSGEQKMKTVKMKIAGIALNEDIKNPLIILKSRDGKIFPVSVVNLDKKTLANAFILKNSVYSELVLKLFSLSRFKIDRILLDKSETSKLISKVYTSAKREPAFEMSAIAGILLSIESGVEILVNQELFNDDSFFKNKIDEKKNYDDFEKFFLNESEFPRNSKTLNSIKEIVQ